MPSGDYEVSCSCQPVTVQRDLRKSMTKFVTFIVSQLIGNSNKISLPVIRKIELELAFSFN